MTEADRAAWIKKEWKRIREFAWRSTATKATERAVRKVLIIPDSFLPEELKKPFLVPSISFTLDPNDKETLHAVLGIGQKAIASLYGGEPAAEDEIDAALRESDDDGAPTGTITDPQTGVQVDPETGVIEGTAVEEAEDTTEQPETHGPRPTEGWDVVLPRGPFKGVTLPDICRDNPDYVKTKLLKTEGLGPMAESLLVYFHGEEAIHSDYSDIDF
jgi:hypothetical protein